MRRMLSRMVRLLIYPSIYLYANPFRIVEYNSLVGNAACCEGKIVLDLGCGGGQQARCFARRAQKVVGLDPDERAIACAKAEPNEGRRPLNVEFVCSSIEEAGFSDRVFDVIMSVCVLEHIPDYRRVLLECHRVLKEGGVFLLSVDSLGPISTPLVERHRKEHKVAQYFTPMTLTTELRNAGFCHVDIRPILRSGCARRRFERGIQNGFKYTRVGALMQYAGLMCAEWMHGQEGDGIFLVAKCRR